MTSRIFTLLLGTLLILGDGFSYVNAAGKGKEKMPNAKKIPQNSKPVAPKSQANSGKFDHKAEKAHHEKLKAEGYLEDRY